MTTATGASRAGGSGTIGGGAQMGEARAPGPGAGGPPVPAPSEPVAGGAMPEPGVPQGTGGPLAEQPSHPTGPGRTRTSAAWSGLIAAAIVLVLLLVFILQNLGSVRITYFTASGSFPLGAALLLAAIGGVLLAGLVASLRIVQLRRRIRRRGRPDGEQPGGTPGARRR